MGKFKNKGLIISLMSKLIYLLSDFGHVDTSVGEMHAVIKSIDDTLIPIDLTHEIASFNVIQGAYMLESRLGNISAPHSTVAVVDPGVGSERKGIVIKTKEKGYLVGPDNGILIPAAERYGILESRAITNSAFFNPAYEGVLPSKEDETKKSKSSDIFQGRDIFASTAAFLDKLNFYNVGKKLEFEELVKAPYEKAKKKEEIYIGEIPFIDEYGNVFTNVLLNELTKFKPLSILNIEIYDNQWNKKTDILLPFGRNFACVDEGQALACDDSYGYLHLCSNMANFSENYKVELGDRILLL